MSACGMIGKELDGELIVLEYQTGWDQPVRYRMHWPTGVYVCPTTEYLIGKEVRYWRDGVWLGEDGLRIELKDLGQTHPISHDVEPLAPPTRSKKWKWANGQWQRS